MKYKLINKTTGEEHICDKMVVDGWDYYVSDEGVVNPCYFYNKPTNYLGKALRKEGNFWVCENIEGFHLLSEAKKVIATNNPDIDIPKVVDEVEIMAEKCTEETQSSRMKRVWKAGYNKSQETHPFTEEDVKEIFKIAQMQKNYGDYKPYTFEEAIQLWKEQRTKTLYYE